MYDSPEARRSGLVPGILAGLAAALVGAGLYAVIIDLTEWELGIATIGIGVLVGLAIMAVKPTSPVLPALAAVISLAGAALGTIAGDVALIVKIAGDQGLQMSYGDAFGFVRNGLGEFIDIKTVLIWAVGAAAAFSFVNKRVKASAESASLPQEAGAPQPVADLGLAPMTTPQATPAESEQGKPSA
ncbi:hypothetical protein [Planotetraspora sp. GP83]|uniref:hypothetical protein n=1 Tax=Planotetraspora sp. GP83 TaxID=3156264 RepID=UPI003512B110